MYTNDSTRKAGSNRPTGQSSQSSLKWIARLCAAKAGYTAATVLAVLAGSRWGWVISKGNVDALFLLSGVFTVVGYCVCAVKIWRGSKVFYLFGVLLNGMSVGVVAVRGAVGPVGMVALTLSVFMLILMALPMSWKAGLAGASLRGRPVELVAPLLVGAAILSPMFILGGESGAARDGLLQGSQTESGPNLDELDGYLEQSGVDRDCLMGKIFFEFGSATLSSWNDTGPSAKEIERIQKLAQEC